MELLQELYTAHRKGKALSFNWLYEKEAFVLHFEDKGAVDCLPKNIPVEYRIADIQLHVACNRKIDVSFFVFWGGGRGVVGGSWDPGGSYFASSVTLSLWFKQWDPIGVR